MVCELNQVCIKVSNNEGDINREVYVNYPCRERLLSGLWFIWNSKDEDKRWNVIMYIMACV
jgi:hypothetical protein